jgi:hypothetical protein
VRAASVVRIITKMDFFRERASAADVLLLGVREGGGLTNFDRKTARDTLFLNKTRSGIIYTTKFMKTFIFERYWTWIVDSILCLHQYLPRGVI